MILRQPLVLILCLAANLLTGCGEQSPPPPLIESQTQREGSRADIIVPNAVESLPVDYVGSMSCAECHADISRTYAATTMGNSAATAEDAEPMEAYPDRQVVMSRLFHARAVKTETGMQHEESLLARDGSVLCTQKERIAYVIGSGRRGRSYLVERDDQLMMSPLTWYSTKGVWDASPGYASNNLHFERRAVEECLQCHVGRVAKADNGLPDRVSKPAFIEAGIGCERCHGPGGRHVEWHRARLDQATVRDDSADPIVNPGKLSPALRDSVCNDCHQLGVERVLRFGKSPGDFRPGQPLSSIWVVFNKAHGTSDEDSLEAVNQVRQMEMSTCFIRSEGRMGCISCHDPHELPSEETRIEYFRNRCLDCHSAPKSECSEGLTERLKVTAEDSCAACHMPSLPAADVQHTSQTDHRILRRPSEEVPHHSSEALELAAEMDAVPDWEIERARGLLMSRFAVDQNDRALAMVAADILLEITNRGLSDSVVESALGDCYHLQNRLEVAEPRWRRALELNPKHESALKSLSIALHDAGRDEEAAMLMKKFLERNRWDRTITGRHIHILGRLGRHEEALAEAREAVKRYPYDGLIREWLANACEAAGQTSDAAEHRKVAERIRNQ